MKRAFIITGKGRCKGTTTRVMALDEDDARRRLLRDDASPYYDIDTVREEAP